MPIVVNEQEDHFFISINKIGGHSFVMLGIYDQNNIQHVLCRVGKVVDSDKNDSICSIGVKFWYNVLFFSSKAKLIDEKIIRFNRELQPISYQAYDISFNQYLEFIRILESLQTEKIKFTCYKPKKIKDKKIILEFTDELLCPKEPIPIAQIKDNLSELSIKNTCRHSAIALIEATLHTPIASLVSSNWFTDLPYETVLEYGKPSKNIPFYVLPASPHAFPELNETKKKIITKLYSRMEQMLCLNIHERGTQEKYLQLKELYLQILGVQKELPLNELLESIQNWKQQNQSVLSTLRKTYFWDYFLKRQSATMNLISEVEHDLKTALSV